MQNILFFDLPYQIANNIGRVVGLSDEGPLILHKNWEQGTWELETLPSTDIIRINATRFRSLYILLMGVIAALTTPIVAYIGLSGRAIGPGVLFIPILMAVFAYLALTGSKRMRIAFECADKTAIFKGSFRCAEAHIPELQRWAAQHQVPLSIQFPALVTPPLNQTSG